MMTNLGLIFLFLGFIKSFKLNLIYTFTFISVYLIIYTFMSQSEVFFMDSVFYYDETSSILVTLSIWVSILMVYSSYKIFRFGEFSFYFYIFVFFYWWC